VPLWGAVLPAAWAAIIVQPLYRPLAKRIRGRQWAAALLTVLLVVMFLAPVLIITLSLSGAAVDLGKRLLESKSGGEALKALTAGGDGASIDLGKFNWQQALDLARRHGASAMGAAKSFLGAATIVVVGVVVFLASFYTFLVDGPRAYGWFLERSPLSRAHFHRLGSVFAEVGRGLLVGVGLTALLQGAVATIGYVVTGVPQPFVLGLVTVFASLIPSVGSGLVWVPVTAGLALSGRVGAAIVMLVIGCVVSVVDNLLRPMLSRYGKLRLNGLVTFIAMLGGIAAFGGGGLLLGPLFVRMAAEGLTMLREEREAGLEGERKSP
jgi:predicted PurR-regulated permease PerM